MISGKSNILILGAGVTQIPLINTAKEMGYHVIVASIPGDYPGFAHADEVCYINTTDEDGILRLAVEKRIIGLCTTGTDVAVRSIGYVNSKLGLSGITYEASQLVTDKAKMKAALVSGGVRTAEFRRVFTVEEAKIAANEIGYPVMFKCTDQAASKGITKVNSVAEAESSYAYAIEGSKKPYIVVEKYIEGYEIGLDGYVSDKSEVFIPHDKLTRNNGVTDIPIGHSLPYLCPGELYKDIIEQAELSCKALSLDYCFINMDLMISNGKCYVIEIGGRTGATCIPDLLSLYCGYNYYEKIIENAVGKIPNMIYEPQCACVAELLVSKKGGRLINADVDECNKIRGLRCSLDIKVGSNVKPFHVGTDRFGQIVSWEETYYRANKLLKIGKNILNIEISEDKKR
jgi:biotin carboxylase